MAGKAPSPSNKIELPKATHEAVTQALTRYLKEELDLEVTGFDAVFLTDFIIETLGPHVYNQALADAHALATRQLEDLGERLWTLEKVVKTVR
ncbi:MAG: DUF2164 domain-containing protein [Phenylobacterium sp.]|nr:DUF2164 domain-containing protein [Phenylobacterium sp.]